ncbi:MAG: 5'-methylthioadenosine/S-adenosylhomocysteine nucleosidase [Aliiglaciecola sp.]
MDRLIKTAFFSLIIYFLTFNTWANTDAVYGPKAFDIENEWTAIVAAYEPEIAAIEHAFSQTEDATITSTVAFKGVTYQLGNYKGEPVVIFATGVSVANAAMTVQMAIDYFPIERVVMMGIAGAVNPEFRPGDIAVPERWYYHDESVYVNPQKHSANDYILPDYYQQQLDSYAARRKTDPHTPDYQNFGFIHPNEVSVIKQGWQYRKKIPYFSATPELVALSHKALAKIPPITLPSGKEIKVEIGGNGVTGSVFLDNADYRLWLHQVFNAQVTEMESAAVGQVCFVNNIDWVVIRSVSDLAGGQKGKNEENVFDAIASGTGTKLMMGLLDEIVKIQRSNP